MVRWEALMHGLGLSISELSASWKCAAFSASLGLAVHSITAIMSKVYKQSCPNILEHVPRLFQVKKKGLFGCRMRVALYTHDEWMQAVDVRS